MRELTDRELDAVGGAGFSFTNWHNQIHQTLTNYATVEQEGGIFSFASPQTATVTQVNVALGSIF